MIQKIQFINLHNSSAQKKYTVQSDTFGLYNLN